MLKLFKNSFLVLFVLLPFICKGQNEVITKESIIKLYKTILDQEITESGNKLTVINCTSGLTSRFDGLSGNFQPYDTLICFENKDFKVKQWVNFMDYNRLKLSDDTSMLKKFLRKNSKNGFLAFYSPLIDYEDNVVAIEVLFKRGLNFNVKDAYIYKRDENLWKLIDIARLP